MTSTLCEHVLPGTLVVAGDGCSLECSVCHEIVLPVNPSIFELVPLKREGTAVPYDPTRPNFPPETWRDRLRWRTRRLRARLKAIMWPTNAGP